MTDNTDRLLGRIISNVEALQREQERVQRELTDSRKKRDAEIHDINKKVNTLHDYVTEAKGGKRVLAALLFAATAFGGVIWELLQRFMK